MTLDEIIEYYHKGITERGGCGGPVMFACLLIIFLLTGCKTITNEESCHDIHHMEILMERMDSLISMSYVVQQDSSWRETFIKELQSIREKSDTNHIQVVDTAGNVIKETIVINNLKEVTNERYEHEIEGMRHSIEQMDSTIAVQSQQLSRMDSAFQQMIKETTIEKKQSWWDGLLQNVKGIIIGIVFGGIAVYILRWKKVLP